MHVPFQPVKFPELGGQTQFENAFENYLTKRVVKYVKLPGDKSSEPVLILYDGNRSPISLNEPNRNMFYCLFSPSTQVT